MTMLLRPRFLLQLLLIVSIAIPSGKVIAQNIIVNTAMLEGLDITPDNMWGFQVQSLDAENISCTVDGSIIFRSSGHSIKFSFPYTVKPGLNTFDPAMINPKWTYSSSALQELFTYHKILPQGTYRYCITIAPKPISGEQRGAGQADDCIYKQSKDLFSITLLEPENDAKIYEYNPMLTWIATYPFVNELTYKIRVAEIRNGQSTENAITRNNPVYSENNLIPNSIIYPVYAKPLRVWQPYAWTVDAYFKGILLGGAQPWKFTIVEDSVMKALPKESSYIDINIDKGNNVYYAVGKIKLRYAENDLLKNELSVKIMKKGSEVKIKDGLWPVQRGVNFKEYDLTDYRFGHNEAFEVIIERRNSKSNQITQTIKYKYVNPDFVK